MIQNDWCDVVSLSLCLQQDLYYFQAWWRCVTTCFSWYWTSMHACICEWPLLHPESRNSHTLLNLNHCTIKICNDAASTVESFLLTGNCITWCNEISWHLCPCTATLQIEAAALASQPFVSLLLDRLLVNQLMLLAAGLCIRIPTVASCDCQHQPMWQLVWHQADLVQGGQQQQQWVDIALLQWWRLWITELVAGKYSLCQPWWWDPWFICLGF